MKRFVFHFCFYTILLGVSFFWGQACDVGHGLEPIRSRIAGEVSFIGSPPLDSLVSIAEVRVVATKKFPPENLTTDLVYSHQIDFKPDSNNTGSYSVPFEVIAPPGVYPAVGVLWRESGKAWEITNLLGVYLDLATFAPKPVELPENDSVVDGVEIPATWEFASSTSFIEGDITFRGEWPEDTRLLPLVTYENIPDPNNVFSFITFKSLDLTVPLFIDDSYHYRIRVPATELKFIALFWISSSLNSSTIRAIGFYSCPDDSTVPKSVVVPEKTTITGIDIDVDFTTLPGGARYVLDGECKN